MALQGGDAASVAGEAVVLKKYLRGKRVPEPVLEELDALCHNNEQRWQTAISRIAKLLEP